MEPLSSFIRVTIGGLGLPSLPVGTLVLTAVKRLTPSTMVFSWQGRQMTAQVGPDVHPGDILRLKVQHLSSTQIQLKILSRQTAGAFGLMATALPQALLQAVFRTGIPLRSDIQNRLQKIQKHYPESEEALRLGAVLEEKGLLSDSAIFPILQSIGQQQAGNPDRPPKPPFSPEPSQPPGDLAKDPKVVQPVEAVQIFNSLSGSSDDQWIVLPILIKVADRQHEAAVRFCLNKKDHQVKYWGFSLPGKKSLAFFFPDAHQPHQVSVILGDSWGESASASMTKSLAQAGYQAQIYQSGLIWDGFTAEPPPTWKSIDEEA